MAWLIAESAVEIKTPPPRYYNVYSCRTQGASNVRPQSGATFKILDVFRLNTNQLADRLCTHSEISAHYASVEVIWMHRDQVDLREIVKQAYQLVLTKPELLARLAETRSTVYAPLASYQDYESQLISLKDVPELTNSFFAGKRLGLIDDPNSLSGYQIPKTSLQSAHIDEAAFTTVYFKSHAALHRALRDGQVDVIGSYSAAYFGTAKRLDLQRGLSSLQWYLHPQLIDTAIHCEIYRDLARFPSSVGKPSSIVKPANIECADAG